MMGEGGGGGGRKELSPFPPSRLAGGDMFL